MRDNVRQWYANKQQWIKDQDQFAPDKRKPFNQVYPMQDLIIIQNELNEATQTEEEPFPLEELRQLDLSVGQK